MDINEIKKVLFEVIDEYSGIGAGYFQQGPVLHEAAKRLKITGFKQEQALLIVWGDLFRSGIIWWGLDLHNNDLPFLHITDKGKSTLENISRDPSNPEGYMNYISDFHINDVASSYLREALETYNNNCFKASAVMIGAASESLILEIRDNFVAKITDKGETASSKFKDKRINAVINKISNEIETNKETMPDKLYDSFSVHFNSFIGQIRISRNDAGHPKSIFPVDEETVHSNLLIFPTLLKLVYGIDKWIKDEY